MKTKKKYNVDGEKVNIKAVVSRKGFLRMKALSLVKCHSKDMAVDIAIDLYNEKFKDDFYG